jgi:hypothetical protein
MIEGPGGHGRRCFTTARAYGVKDAVPASLKETLPGVDCERPAAESSNLKMKTQPERLKQRPGHRILRRELCE